MLAVSPAMATPIDWPTAAIRDPASLGTEILNGPDLDGNGIRDGVTLGLCQIEEMVTVCGDPPSGAPSYQVFVLRFNSMPNVARPGGYDQAYAVALVPLDVWEGGAPLPGLLTLHGYPFIGAGQYRRSLTKAMQTADRLKAWVLALHGPGFGLVRDSNCDSGKDLSGYDRGLNYLDKGASWDHGVWELLGLPPDECDLVSDFEQGKPCVDTWLVPHAAAADPDLTYLPAAYAYSAMRGITLMESLFVAPSTPLTSQMMVVGTSFGGLTTFLVNGSDDRLDAAVVIVATGDLAVSLAEPSAGLRNLLAGAAGRYVGDPAVQTALSRLDPILYAPTQHSPLLMLVSATDPLFVPKTYQSTFDAVLAPAKRMHISFTEGLPPDAGHTYSFADEQIRTWFAAHLENAVTLPPLLTANSANLWLTCSSGPFKWTCPKTRIEVDLAALAAADSVRALASATGTSWKATNDAFHQHRLVPATGTVTFDLHWNHTLVEAEHSLAGASENFHLRQSASWSDAQQQFPVYQPPEVAKCLEHGACWKEEDVDFCNGL